MFKNDFSITACLIMFPSSPNNIAFSSFYLFCPLHNFWWFSWYKAQALLHCDSLKAAPLPVLLKTPWRSIRKSFIVFTAMSLSSRRDPQLSALCAVQQNRCLRFLFYDKNGLSFSRILASLYMRGVNVVLCTIQELILTSPNTFVSASAVLR